MRFVQLHHLSLTIWMGEVMLEESCGLSSENVLPVKMGQTQIYPTAWVFKRSSFGQVTLSTKYQSIMTMNSIP